MQMKKLKMQSSILIERFRSDKKIDRNDIITSLNRDMIKDIKNQSTLQSYRRDN